MLAIEVLAALAAVLHLVFFGMESLFFMRPAVYRRFGAHSPADAQAMRLLALNQGFYNLFLALGLLAGLGLLHMPALKTVGMTLVLFCSACMLAAAVVLRLSAGARLGPAALVQGLPPLLLWLLWLL